MNNSSLVRAGYLADPTIQSLTAILREIEQGLLVFPHFQRPFIWIPEQRVELLKTILRGLPIGTFMTWRTTNQEIPVFENVGRWALPRAAAATGGRQYVLDGLQRLLTLYAALVPNKTPRAGTSSVDDANAPREMFVDLAEATPDVFEAAADPNDDYERRARSIQLSNVLDSRQLIKRQRELKDDSRIERADRVAEALKSYKVPVVPFVSDDLAEVTRAFQLVNSQGTQMSQVHMVNALSWARDFRLLDTMDNLRRGALAEVGWGDLDEVVLLRCFAVVLGLEAYEFDEVELAKLIRSKTRAASQVDDALRSVANLLWRVCHIRSYALVPYTPQIVVLVQALSRLPKPDQRQRDLVRDWLWFTSYVEAFGGSLSASMVARATNSLSNALYGKRFVWDHRRVVRRSFPQQVDFRHARSRVFALRLAARRARHEQKNAAYGLLANEGAKALPNLLPPSVASGAWRFGRGARVVAANHELVRLRSALEGPYDDDSGERFAISEPAWTAYREARFEEFVKLRDEDFEKAEVAHFESVRSRLGIVQS